MPESLDSWQRMFQEIYPRTVEDRDGRSALGLLEEIGELAEAIRVFDEHPKFFVGEAADVFSYIMGFANEHSLRLAHQEDASFSFETEYVIRYPGMCVECGFQVCRCPHIPEATVGRMAKELDIETPEPMFGIRPVINVQGAKRTAELALSRAGGYSSIMLSRFPFDRGDVNEAVVQVSLNVAEQLKSSNPALAETVRGLAAQLGRATTSPGARKHSDDARQLVGTLVDILESPAVGKEIATEAVRDSDLGAVALPKRLRVLVASSKPSGGDQRIRPEVEAQVIADAIERSRYRERIEIIPVPAAQFDHLRRVLLEDNISVVHFAGHGIPDGLAFEDPTGNPMIVSLDTLQEYLARFAEIECVVLNACFSLKDISQPLAQFTVGMEEALSDEAAREFARGFYDALGAGKDYEFAVHEGRLTAKAKGYGDINVKVLGGTS
jgi:NTP pyrophosphatase (non-canonical NTP hydrolase)